MSLPIFQGGDQPFMLMQTSWASLLNPLLRSNSSVTSNTTSGLTVAQEFAWNFGNVTAAGGVDNTSFGNGPQGTPILAYNSTTGGNSRTTFRCQFVTPFNINNDTLFLEFMIQGNPNVWMDSLNAGVGWTVQNNTFFGAVIVADIVSTNQVNIWFGNGGYGPEGNGAYGSTGGLWSVFTPSGKWRLRKVTFG